MHSNGARAAIALLALGLAGPASPADFKVTDDLSFSAGIGLKASYSRADFGAPNGTSDSNDFDVENGRLFFSGSYARMFKATVNIEAAGATTQILDGIAQLELMPEFNIWLGRMLPPSDRANLYGPFYTVTWTFPGTASNYPGIFAGRDDGATVWGKLLGGKLVYSVGMFEGHNKAPGLSGETDKLLYAGRIQYAFWDAEPAPAYLTGGWYGGKDILTIGLAGNQQADGVGVAGTAGSLKVWSADILFEKKFGGGTPTLEGAYYKYKLGALDCNSGEPGAPACAPGNNIGGQVDGKSYLLGAAFLFPQTVGWGQFQPFVRYQQFERTVSATTAKTTDFGVNYLIRGPNARITLQYTNTEDKRAAAPMDDIDKLFVGVQLIM